MRTIAIINQARTIFPNIFLETEDAPRNIETMDAFGGGDVGPAHPRISIGSLGGKRPSGMHPHPHRTTVAYHVQLLQPAHHPTAIRQIWRRHLLEWRCGINSRDFHHPEPSCSVTFVRPRRIGMVEVVVLADCLQIIPAIRYRTWSLTSL